MLVSEDTLTTSDAVTDKSYDLVTLALRIWRNLSMSACFGMCHANTYI